MNIRKITLGRIASHDFNRALRVLKSQMAANDILVALAQQRTKALAATLRNFGLATVGTLWLLANKSEMSLKLTIVELSIPASYVNFVVATLLLGAVLHGVSYMMLNDFVRVASNKLFKFDAPWALTAMIDGQGVWSNGALAQWRFLSSNPIHKRLGKLSIVLVNLPLLVMAVVIVATVIYVGAHVIAHEGLLTLGGVFTITSWILLLSSFAQIVIMQAPFTFARNKRFIRWSFLYRMHRRYGVMPKLVDVWLAEAAAEKTRATTSK